MDEKAAALDRLARLIDLIVNPPADNVVSFPTGAGGMTDEITCSNGVCGSWRTAAYETHTQQNRSQ